MSEKIRNYRLFMDDILEAIAKIERYTKDKTFEDFSRSEMTVDAVVRNFEIIGEAARNIPKTFQDKYPFVEWKEMVGFRNVLIHDYFGIDIESVWDTVNKNVPLLKEHVLQMIDLHNRSDS